MALERVEIWSNLACASGARLAICPVTSASTAEAIEGKTATQRLTLTVPRDATAAIAELVPRKVIRLLFTDGEFEEYRIQDVVDSAQATTVQVKANGILFDLALGEKLLTQTTSPLVTTQYTKVDTAANLVAHALTFAPSYFASGTVTPTATASVAFSDDTALSALAKIADAMAAATGTTYELSARRNGTTDYKLDLTVLNTSATVPDIRTGKNLQSLRRTRSSRDQATRVYPITSGGDGAAWFKVTAVSTNAYIEIDTIDGSAINPILEDDALNGKYWIHEDGVAHEITDTTKSSKRLAMASTTGIAVGEWGYLASNSSGDVLRMVDYPSAQTSVGIQNLKLQTSLSGLTNFIKNADFSDWPTATADPTDWTVLGAGLTRESGAGLWVTGGYAAKMTGNLNLEQSRSLNFATTGQATYTVRLRIAAFNTAGTSGINLTNPMTGSADAYALNGTVSGLDRLNEWLTFTKTYDITSTGVKTCKVLLVTAGSGVSYIDAVSLTINASGTDIVDGSGGATAWLKGVTYLQQNSTAPVTYEATLLDLSRLDSGTWPYDALALGGSVNVTDLDLNLTATLRAVQIDRDHLNPLSSRVTLSTRPTTLTDLLVTE